MIGFSIRLSSATNAAIRTAARAPNPSTSIEPQPWLVDLDDRVDRGHQRGGDQQRAEPVDTVLESLAMVVADHRLAEDERQAARSGG